MFFLATNDAGSAFLTNPTAPRGFGTVILSGTGEDQVSLQKTVPQCSDRINCCAWPPSNRGNRAPYSSTQKRPICFGAAAERSYFSVEKDNDGLYGNLAQAVSPDERLGMLRQSMVQKEKPSVENRLAPCFAFKPVKNVDMYINGSARPQKCLSSKKNVHS